MADHVAEQMAGEVTEYEQRYRRGSRLLLYLFLVWMPVMGCAVYSTVNWPRVSWLFSLIGFLYMCMLLALSIHCLVAYRRWKHSKKTASTV
jgi:hypothetical protein